MSDASVTPDALPSRPKFRRWLHILLALCALAALLWLGRAGAASLENFANWVKAQGAWGPAFFALGYALAVIACVPGSLLTLAVGALFGIAQGTALVFAAAVAGASAAFLLARTLLRRNIERRLAGNAKFAAVDRAVGREGRKIVFLLRLSPVFPFNLLNYALGLTRVRFSDALLASVGMLPGTLLYVYLGKVIGDVAAVFADGAAQVEKGGAYYAVLVLGLVATAAVTTLVTRTARRALREATQEVTGPTQGGA